MSLIYDALKQQAGVGDAGRPRPRAPWWQRVPAQGRAVLMLGTGALIAAPLYLLAGAATVPVEVAHSGTAPPVASSASTPVPLPTVDATAVRAVAPTVPAPEAGAAPAAPPTVMPAFDGAPVASTDAHERMSAAPPPVTSTMAQAPAAESMAAPVPAPATATATARSPAPMRITVDQRHAGDGAVPVHDDAAIHRAIAAVEAAVAAGDDDGADAGVSTLESLLPPGSLTLLRIRAWVAHGRGGRAEAEELYRQIIERVPDDENAGLNIALLDARRGDVADARQRLMRLSGPGAASPLVDRALAELDGLP